MKFKDAQQLFEPYFAAPELGEGAAFGLAEAYGIIRGHRGQISFKSSAGQGSTFEILLPLSDPSQLWPASGGEQPVGPREKRGLVLVVGHEAEPLGLLTEALGRLDYEVIAAKNSTEGLALVSERHRQIGLTIINQDLPVERGVDFVRIFTHMVPAAQIILTSERPDEQLPGPVAKADLSWPFTQERLAAAIQVAADKGGSRRGSAGSPDALKDGGKEGYGRA